MIGRSLFFTTAAHLSFKMEQISVVSRADERQTTVPLEDVNCIVLEHPQITCSVYLLQALAERNIATVFCNEKYHPVGMLMSLNANQLQSKRFRMQLEASEPLKKGLWKETVRQKIANQAAVLDALTIDSAALMHKRKRVRSGDVDNQEGQAAGIYWNRLLGADFRRERFGHTPNSALNYGYAIIRAAMARSIAASGLHPTLGIHHRNQYNAYCLADDLMEPYRPFVDMLVYQRHQEGKIEAELSQETKAELIQILHTDCRLGKQNRPLSVAMNRTAVSLVHCYEGDRKSIDYPRPLWH